jgi:hypothetical protein
MMDVKLLSFCVALAADSEAFPDLFCAVFQALMSHLPDMPQVVSI